MAVLHDIKEKLSNQEPTAPPSWANTYLTLLNGDTILHGGTGILQGAWHSQDSDEVLLVLAGQCTVETREGDLSAGAGQLIHISANEPHRVTTDGQTLLVAIESTSALRTSLIGPKA